VTTGLAFPGQVVEAAIPLPGAKVLSGIEELRLGKSSCKEHLPNRLDLVVALREGQIAPLPSSGVVLRKEGQVIAFESTERLIGAPDDTDVIFGDEVEAAALRLFLLFQVEVKEKEAPWWKNSGHTTEDGGEVFLGQEMVEAVKR
jgi:hypothetical protein